MMSLERTAACRIWSCWHRTLTAIGESRGCAPHRPLVTNAQTPIPATRLGCSEASTKRLGEDKLWMH
jgi:hypothetical protein